MTAGRFENINKNITEMEQIQKLGCCIGYVPH
jgi:hypothetical protein